MRNALSSAGGVFIAANLQQHFPASMSCCCCVLQLQNQNFFSFQPPLPPSRGVFSRYSRARAIFICLKLFHTLLLLLCHPMCQFVCQTKTSTEAKPQLNAAQQKWSWSCHGIGKRVDMCRGTPKCTRVRRYSQKLESYTVKY